MKKLLMISVALMFVSCAHMKKDKPCCAKDAKQCKVHKKDCDSKKCKMHKKGQKKHSAEECDKNSCKVHRAKKK
ncbi:hypothetical protein [Halobacteriovorax sp.]|uniref:hypothetical protein n=1 Tax=Halobacteriovorax sp. TaxID=2020862 RepID=UPI00356336C0